MKSGAE